MPLDPRLDFRQLRQAADSARAAELSGEVMPLVRPRLIAGLVRQRPRLATQLRIGGRDGRLVWCSPDAYCLLDPPPMTPARSGRLWTILDQYWSLAVALCVAGGLFAAVLVIVLTASLVSEPPYPDAVTLSAIALVAVGLALYLIFMVAHLSLGVLETAKSFGDGRHLERIVSDHWSVRLLHATDPDLLDDLIANTRARIGGKVLLVELRRVTTRDARAALANRPDAHPVGEEGQHPTVLAVGADARLTRPRRRYRPARVLLLFLATVVAALSVTSWLIAGVERAACAPDCADRPARWVDALYWLVSRMLSFDADGITAATWEARLLGLAWTLFGLVILGAGVGLLLQEGLSRNRSAGAEIVDRFNSERRSEEERAGQQAGQRASRDVGTGPDGTTRRDQAGGSGPEYRQVPVAWFFAGLAVGLLIRRGSRRARVGRRTQA